MGHISPPLILSIQRQNFMSLPFFFFFNLYYKNYSTKILHSNLFYFIQICDSNYYPHIYHVSFSWSTLHYKFHYYRTHSQFFGEKEMIRIKKIPRKLGQIFVNRIVRGLEFGTWNLLISHCYKQGGRILKNPFSLLSQVMQGKYYLQDNFSTASLGYRPSYLWRSILAARPYLLQGLRWWIGNGYTTRVQQDKRLTTPHSFKISSPANMTDFDHISLKCLSSQILREQPRNMISFSSILIYIKQKRYSKCLYVMTGPEMSRSGHITLQENSKLRPNVLVTQFMTE